MKLVWLNDLTISSDILVEYGSVLKYGYPWIIHYQCIFHCKPFILGIAHVWKPPYSIFDVGQVPNQLTSQRRHLAADGEMFIQQLTHKLVVKIQYTPFFVGKIPMDATHLQTNPYYEAAARTRCLIIFGQTNWWVKLQTAKQQNLFHATDLKPLGVDTTEWCSASPLELQTQNFKNFLTTAGTTTLSESEHLEIPMVFHTLACNFPTSDLLRTVCFSPWEMVM